MFSKVVLLFAALCAVFAFPQKDFLRTKEKGLGIFNGKTTTIKQHNYLVGIVYNSTYVCAGTIVSSQWVVTTAECLEGIFTTYQLNVVAGSSDGVTGTKYNVLKVIPHPNYANATNMDYNYACVQIDGSFKFTGNVGKAVLPSKEPKNNMKMMVAGYGDTSSIETEVTGQLLQGNMNWLPKTQCETTYSAYLNWTERMACASSSNKITLCNGDYGNAFVVKAKKINTFYGIFAGGVATGFCSASAKPVLISDVYQVADWIKDITGASKDE